MERLPQVDVLIASYNHTAFVAQAIASVLAQTYPQVRLQVVDDGSTDGSAAQLQGLSERQGFGFRAQANQGLSATLNRMIGESSGTYIVPFGSDDLMLPGRLATQVEYMEAHPETGLCGGNIEFIGADGALLPRSRQRRRPARRLSFEDILLERKPGIPAPTLMIRRSAWELAGPLDPGIGLEDLQLALKIAWAGQAVDVLEETLARYRVHPGNTYRNHAYMIDSVLRTYARFAGHPQVERARGLYLNRMLVKLADRDKALARKVLGQIPWRHRNLKTLKGISRMLLRW